MTTPVQPPPAPHGLTRDEVDRFHRDGYLGPYAACSPDEMAAIRERIDREVFATDPDFDRSGSAGPGLREQSRHLDRRVVYDLCSRPAVVDRMAGLYGPDLVLWRSNFFVKRPGGSEIQWHQDLNYWPIEPLINVSAWLAIDEVTAENSCVQVIPGSHREVIPHVRDRSGGRFLEEADPAYYDASRAVDMELRPGEFFLFTERLLHHSAANRSDRRRAGLSIRVTLPCVRVYHEQLFAGHRCIQLSGRDPLGFNRMAQPPAA